ncbi:MAG: HlyD family type I secretion periplasmic adaptor subunit [Ramlibacter sp.]|jgi:adhesin transport system membrane fusion protein|nr:HlyD family type I secretion periplasmic adaptor subunit [Ramlibacter sp.]
MTTPNQLPATRPDERLPALTTGLSSKDLAYTQDVYQALVTENQHIVAWILAIICALLGSLLAWASLTTVEEITVGEGRVIPAGREQVIQSLEGGIISELYVREGAIVAAGEKLVRIDPTKARSSMMEGVSKSLALKATAARLRAESTGGRLVFPVDVLLNKALVQSETQTYNARSGAVDASVAGLRRSKELANKELQMLEPLAARGLVAETEVLRLRRSINEVDLQIIDKQTKLRADAASELVKVESELAQINENLTAREDVLRRTELVAPVRGTVKSLKFNTVGGVVQAAQDIMEIVPLEDRLLVEAKVRPADVAFLRPGLEATVKISAYDYAVYGGLKGKVELISPDTVKDEPKRGQGQADESFYKVQIRTDTATLTNQGKPLPIIPGMTAVVEIKTGEKSVLSYLLKPVNKAREALRER